MRTLWKVLALVAIIAAAGLIYYAGNSRTRKHYEAMPAELKIAATIKEKLYEPERSPTVGAGVSTQGEFVPVLVPGTPSNYQLLVRFDDGRNLTLSVPEEEYVNRKVGDHLILTFQKEEDLLMHLVRIESDLSK